jgi:haloalkane dehalogenase
VPDAVERLRIGWRLNGYDTPMSTWAWPESRLRVRLFSARIGGPLSPFLVERLNLMVRVYLPRNLRQAPLTDAGRRAYEGPWPPGQRAPMRVLPREIVRGRGYLGVVEASLPRLAARPALIVWPDSDPGFGENELGRWQPKFPTAPTVPLRHVGQFIDEDAPDDLVRTISGSWDATMALGAS